MSFLDGFKGRDLGSSTSADLREKKTEERKTNSREVTIYNLKHLIGKDFNFSKGQNMFNNYMQWMSFSYLLFSVMCSCWLPALGSAVGLEDETEVRSSMVGFTEGVKLLEVGLT